MSAHVIDVGGTSAIGTIVGSSLTTGRQPQVTERSMRLCEEYRSKVQEENKTRMARRTTELTEAVQGKVRELMDLQKKRPQKRVVIE